MFIRHPLTLLTKEVPPLSLSPQTTAILVQDLHAPFADDAEGWLATQARAKVVSREFDEYFETLRLLTANITQSLSVARRAGFQVVYSCLGYHTPESPSTFQAATGWDWCLDDVEGRFPGPWQPHPQEPIFAKPGWGATANPQFESYLQSHQIKTVVVVGAMFEFGIRQTCLALADQGYQCLVISDAVVPLTAMGQRYTAGMLAHGLVKLRSTGEFTDLVARIHAEEAVWV